MDHRRLKQCIKVLDGEYSGHRSVAREIRQQRLSGRLVLAKIAFRNRYRCLRRGLITQG